MKNPFFDEKYWLMEEDGLVQLLNSGIEISADALSGKKRPYKMEGNIAVISIAGTLNPRIHWPPYASSYTTLKDQINAAVKDPQVRSILLDINSPGGTVSGCEDLSLAIKAANKLKSVYAYAGSQATSAAYWAGAGAKRFAAARTANIGSIGVIAVHLDYSEAAKAAGVTPTIFRAGEFKALGHRLESLSDKAKASLQARLDQTCQIFIEAVSSCRKKLKISESKEWAEGKVFLGEDAKAVGLIDRVCSRDELTSQLLKEANMDANELRVQYPEAVKAIEDGAKAEAASQIEEAKTNANATAVSVAEAIFGKESSAKFKTVLDAGVDASAVSAVVAALGVKAEELPANNPAPGADQPDPEAEADNASRKAILEGLQANDQGGVIPGANNPTAPKENPLLANMKAMVGKES